MYRPKDWKNPYCELCYMTYIADGNKCKECECMYEAGADAMLEGLETVKDRVIVNEDEITLVLPSLEKSSRSGVWYFIPDEEERDADIVE